MDKPQTTHHGTITRDGSKQRTIKKAKNTLTAYELDLLYRVQRLGYEVLTVCLTDQRARDKSASFKTQNCVTSMTPMNKTIKTRKIS